jgi:hypothetical protein
VDPSNNREMDLAGRPDKTRREGCYLPTSGDSRGGAPTAEPIPATTPVSGRRWRVTDTAWFPTADLSEQRWLECGIRLGRAGSSVRWWLGDWLAYGHHRYGDRYASAARLTGYEPQTLMNFVYVAAHVPPARRRAGVSWSHHAELASMPEETQAEWIDLIVTKRLRIADLRKELKLWRRELRRDDGPASATTDAPHTGCAEPTTEPEPICPTCGRRLTSPASGTRVVGTLAARTLGISA